jgi:integrase
MAIIRRTNAKKEIRYQVKVRDAAGNWLPTATFRTKAQAEAYERSILGRRDQGETALPPEQRDLSVNDYWLVWTEQCRGQTSDGWKITQDQMARDYVLPVLGPRKLVDVKPADVGWTLESARKKGLSAQTLKHVYALIHKIFEDAVEHYGWLPKNPCLGRYRPKVPRRERDFLSPAQSMKLLEHVRHHYLGPAIWLQILAGLRNSEVQALTWKAIDWERGQILIRAAFNNKEDRIQEHPKQEDWGTAPIPPMLRQYLEELKRKRKEPETAFIAQNEFEQGAMLPYETYLRALRRVCEEAGVPVITPHELRHSCTEMYVQAGASAEDIRRLLNQSSLTATARYMHRTDERLMGIASRIGAQPEPPRPPEVKVPLGRPALRVVR